MKNNLTVMILLLAAQQAPAQADLLPLEWHIRGGIAIIPAEQIKYVAPVASVEFTANPGKHIAAGFFLNYGKGTVTWPTSSGQNRTDAGHMYYGAHVRLTAGKYSNNKPYFQLKYGMLQLTDSYQGKFEQITSGNLSLAFGLKSRLGQRLHLIFPEAMLTLRSKGFGFEKSNQYIFNSPFHPMVTVTTGLVWQIGKD